MISKTCEQHTEEVKRILIVEINQTVNKSLFLCINRKDYVDVIDLFTVMHVCTCGACVDDGLSWVRHCLHLCV